MEGPQRLTGDAALRHLKNNHFTNN